MRSVIFAMLVLCASSVVRADDRELVHNCPCTAGGAPSSESHDWYVQLGVFSDRDAADAYEEAFRSVDDLASTAGAGWLVPGTLDHVPWVVVSRAFPTRKAAQRALKRYRRIASDALVRRFVICPD